MENKRASMKHGAGKCTNLGESTLVRCYQSNVITWNDSIWEVDRDMQIGRHTAQQLSVTVGATVYRRQAVI